MQLAKELCLYTCNPYLLTLFLFGKNDLLLTDAFIDMLDNNVSMPKHFG